MHVYVIERLSPPKCNPAPCSKYVNLEQICEKLTCHCKVSVILLVTQEYISFKFLITESCLGEVGLDLPVSSVISAASMTGPMLTCENKTN